MAASTNDYYKKVADSTVTTLSAPGKALAAASITVGSTTNFPTTTGIIIAIRSVDSSGNLVAGTYTEWSATVSSGTTLALVTTPVYGSDQVYTAGSTTQVYVPLSSYGYNKMIDAELNHTDQDGTLKAGAVDGTAVLADGIVTKAKQDTAAQLAIDTGWNLSYGTTTFPVPNTVTYNGQRSYNIVFNSVDLTGYLNPGTRLRTTRTVAAPTQCTSLNGTTQYYSKSSPAGMTFTDDFVVSAWVKLSSYSGGTVVSRYNGTSGWYFNIDTAGHPNLTGFNAGAGNFSYVISYQSVPLNKWVHITAQLDMSGFPTVGATNSYIMIDGLDVPAQAIRGGTNPTTLIQAGNLEIGSQNGGALPFAGKIAQVAIYNAKVTQATILASMNQGLAGTETSLISAYSFNNSINDLNANANNLTANGSAVATNADSPFGTQASGLISSTLDYGIVQSATFSTNTTVVVQVPEGCTIPTSGGVSAVSYSGQKAPYGFPTSPARWAVYWILRSSNGTGTANNTWGSGTTNGQFAIVAPVGVWAGNGLISHYTDSASSAHITNYTSLSTSNSSETDSTWTTAFRNGVGSGTSYNSSTHPFNQPLIVTSQTTYYIVSKTNVSTGTVSTHTISSDAVSQFTLTNGLL